MSHIPRAGVYAIENLITGEVYVGSSVDADDRLKLHLSEIRRGTHSALGFSAKIKQYQPEDWKPYILQRTADHAELEYLEWMWIRRLKAAGLVNGMAPRRRRYDATAAEHEAFAERVQRTLDMANGDPAEAARVLNIEGAEGPDGRRRWSADSVVWFMAGVGDRAADLKARETFRNGPAQALADRVREMRKTMRWQAIYAELTAEGVQYFGTLEQLVKQYPSQAQA